HARAVAIAWLGVAQVACHRELGWRMRERANARRGPTAVGLVIAAVLALGEVTLVPVERVGQLPLQLVHLSDVEQRPRVGGEGVGSLVLLEGTREVALVLQPIARVEMACGELGRILAPERARPRGEKGDQATDDTGSAASHASAPRSPTPARPCAS